MKHVDEFRDSETARRLTARLKEISRTPARFMEVCGTHTMALFRYGVRELLPDHVELVSGPGCPVCVTAGQDIDRALAAARLPGVIVTTFGDMLRVPGSGGTLDQARADGADVRIVYSPLEALKTAQGHPDRQVIFIGVGFETTAPTVAAAIKTAKSLGLTNFSVLAAHKLLPPAMAALLSGGELDLTGFLLPGHVTTIIGPAPYRPLARKYHVPCVVAGFEPVDILQSLLMLIEQVEAGTDEVQIQYRRAVGGDGNPAARAVMNEVFHPADAVWRGLGPISGSGLEFRDEYAGLDAGRRFDLPVEPVDEPPGCLCGEVLRGMVRPPQCRLFASRCTPETPVGPCMVSSEGTCAAYYKYSR
jgi:hydrogenase expression/formation protein HypD